MRASSIRPRLRTALQNAASVAPILIITEAGIAEAPKQGVSSHKHGGGKGGTDM